MRPQIQFFYDITSPYSFVAFALLRRLRPVWEFDLVLRPIFLYWIFTVKFPLSILSTLLVDSFSRSFFPSHQNEAVKIDPPASNVQKRAHLVKDLARTSRHHEFAMTIPDEFPTNTLKAMRLLQSVRTHGTAQDLEIVTANLFDAYWVRGEKMTSIDTLKAALPAGDQRDRWLAAVEDQDVKKALVDACAEAVRKGAYGAPTMFVTNGDGREEMFFGSDRFDHLADFLGKRWPVATLGNSKL
ncbi:hypothetical protein HKX48_000199 [Thoreauomyces humboldtii]|nr:hypothetical protein HKX48_000199 [Thoreauomyces humboldtii]